jgi:hypothetical protein
MATGETGFADVTYDLIAVQYHALKAGHDYGRYVRDAENAGLNAIAQFFCDTMKEDSGRAARANEHHRHRASRSGRAGPDRDTSARSVLIQSFTERAVVPAAGRCQRPRAGPAGGISRRARSPRRAPCPPRPRSARPS